jgi:serine/threonine-protein kinase HipA
MQHCLAVLANSERADEDRTHFVHAQFVFWLLAATDGHAKNFSLQHRRRGRYSLTPLYDVLSAWPVIGDGPNHVSYPRAKLAMGVKAGNMHYRLRDIQVRHWRRLASSAGDRAWARMVAMAEEVDSVLDAVEAELPADFPPRVWTAVSAGMKRHAASFRSGAAEG